MAEGRLERAATPGTVTKQTLLDDFADHVRSFVDVSGLAPMTVVADTANGMGGLVVPRVFAGLPFDLTVLFPELDGTFPNHPADPIQAENLRDLQAAIREKQADIGLAFDGDAGDFWFNVRPSNTEPLLRLNLEANDTDTCARATDGVTPGLPVSVRNLRPGLAAALALASSDWAM